MPDRPAPIRYPTDPVLDLAARRLILDGLPPSARRIADLVGTSARNVERWRTGAPIRSHAFADRVAVALGYHPWCIWPEWCEYAELELAADAANKARSRARQRAATVEVAA